MIKALKNYLRKRRLVRLLKREACTAFHMQYWGRAHNLADRLNRVLGKPKEHRLAAYQRFKQSFANDACKWPGKWEFGRYSLT